jgi:hypothetical protein
MNNHIRATTAYDEIDFKQLSSLLLDFKRLFPRKNVTKTILIMFLADMMSY